jgi:hypothetical protein
VVGVLLTVAAGALIARSPLGSITSEAFDKVSVTRTSDDGATKVAKSKANAAGASRDDMDQSLVGMATLGAVFLGLSALLYVIVAISLRF